MVLTRYTTKMRSLLFLVLLPFLGCYPPPMYPDPTPEVMDSDACAVASKNIQLVCPAVYMTPAGKPFYEFCVETQVDEHIFLNPSCLAVAKDCKEADMCLQDPKCAQGGSACLKK